MAKRILVGLALLFATAPAIAQFRIVTGTGPDNANEQSDNVIAWETTSAGSGVVEKLYPCDIIGKSLTVVDTAGFGSADPITLTPPVVPGRAPHRPCWFRHDQWNDELPHQLQFRLRNTFVQRQWC